MSDTRGSGETNKLAVFGGRQIRREWVDGQWFFSVVDFIGALTDSPNPRDYWYRMKRREKESSGVELSTFCRQLKLASADGKTYSTDCVNTESAFRIIQSVPSHKAEPFKRVSTRTKLPPTKAGRSRVTPASSLRPSPGGRWSRGGTTWRISRGARCHRMKESVSS